MTNEKVELEGKLFVLVEEDNEETSICAEVSGIDIWKWLENHDGFNVKITLEKKDDTL
jgi:hypothetical protein